MDLVRYCPVCDDEFRPEVAACSDCGGSLVLQEEGLGAQGTAMSDANGADTTSGDWRTALDSILVTTLLPVRTFDSLTELEPALAAFAAVELSSRVLVQNGRYILLIHPDSLAEANAAIHSTRADGDDALDPTFDAAAGRYSNCPACGSTLAANSETSCAECGLELSAPAESVSIPEAE